jgi:hypothetical protein
MLSKQNWPLVGGDQRGNEEREIRICFRTIQAEWVAKLVSGVRARAYARYVSGIKTKNKKQKTKKQKTKKQKNKKDNREKVHSWLFDIHFSGIK